eukprot:s533_g7.t1
MSNKWWDQKGNWRWEDEWWEKEEKKEWWKKGEKEDKEEDEAANPGKDTVSASTKEFGPSDSQKEAEKAKETKDGSKTLTKGTKQTQEEKPLTKGKESSKEEPLPKGKHWQKKESPEEPANSADWARSSSEEYTTSSSSSSPKPPPQKKEKKEEKTPEPVLQMKNTKKIAVDWHGVLALGYGNQATYNHYNNWWLDQLYSNGYEVHLLSFCGWKRSRQVYEWAWKEWSGWASVSFTSDRTGPQGKSKWCLDYGITKIIDDNLDICRECQKDGIKVYPVVDPNKKKKKGQPQLSSWYSDFATAVQEILKEDELP